MNPADLREIHQASGWKAFLSLGYCVEAGRTKLASRNHYGPLVVQKPLYPEGSEVCHTILLHPPGGIAGGDTLEIQINLEPASSVLVTSPGAGKWYRSAGHSAEQRLRFNIAEGGILEWLPQETILFDGAIARMDMDVMLESGAMFIGWEILCLGRSASGERFHTGRLHQTVRIHKDGKPIWGEYGHLRGGDPLLTSPAGLAGCSVTGTMLLAGKDISPDVLEACRAVEVDAAGGVYCGVTVLPNLLVARYLGHKSESARRYFTSLWQMLRPVVAGRPAVLPRIWQT